MHASWWGSLAVAAMLVFSGCKDSKDDKKETSGGGGGSSTPAATDEHAGHDANHPSHGPHDGDLIELGGGEYHAELVHDEAAHKVTIYLLDGTAKKTVAIPDKNITVNLKMDGQPTQVSLKAVADASGKSSQFEITDEEFAHALDEEGSEPSLSLKIGTKSYKGKIVHAHEGEHGHSHD